MPGMDMLPRVLLAAELVGAALLRRRERGAVPLVDDAEQRLLLAHGRGEVALLAAPVPVLRPSFFISSLSLSTDAQNHIIEQGEKLKHLIRSKELDFLRLHLLSAVRYDVFILYYAAFQTGCCSAYQQVVCFRI